MHMYACSYPHVSTFKCPEMYRIYLGLHGKTIRIDDESCAHEVTAQE